MMLTMYSESVCVSMCVLSDLLPAGDHWTLNPVPLLREMAGGVRSNSTETHGPHTSTPHPSSPAWTHPSPGHYKKSALAGDVQSRQELHQVRQADAVALTATWAVEWVVRTS